MADWRSLPRNQKTGRNIRRKNDREGPPGRPYRCTHCQLLISFSTDMNGKTIEVVNWRGDLYVHECEGSQ